MPADYLISGVFFQSTVLRLTVQLVNSLLGESFQHQQFYLDRSGSNASSESHKL